MHSDLKLDNTAEKEYTMRAMTDMENDRLQGMMGKRDTKQQIMDWRMGKQKKQKGDTSNDRKSKRSLMKRMINNHRSVEKGAPTTMQHNSRMAYSKEQLNPYGDQKSDTKVITRGNFFYPKDLKNGNGSDSVLKNSARVKSHLELRGINN